GDIARRCGMRRLAVVSTLAAFGIFGAVAHAATFPVTNTNDSGGGSLRDAIASANAAPGADTITFGVTGTISVTSGPLPAVTDPVVIDGRTAPGFTGAPLVQVDNGTGNSSAIGLEISAGASEVRALSVTDFGTGIQLETAG